MRRSLLSGLLCAGLLAGGVGCSVEKRTYEVSVKNELDRPITVWLVKEYGPLEAGWESPEVMGMEEAPMDDKLPDVVVPPGKTAVCGPIQGEFDKNRGRAYLRVYNGTPTLAEMLAMGTGSVSRREVRLDPGVSNRLMVDDREGFMNVEKVEAGATGESR